MVAKLEFHRAIPSSEICAQLYSEVDVDSLSTTASLPVALQQLQHLSYVCDIAYNVSSNRISNFSPFGYPIRISLRECHREKSRESYLIVFLAKFTVHLHLVTARVHLFYSDPGLIQTLLVFQDEIL